MNKVVKKIAAVALSGLLLGENIFTLENILALALVCAGLMIANGAAKRHTPATCTAEGKS